MAGPFTLTSRRGRDGRKLNTRAQKLSFHLLFNLSFNGDANASPLKLKSKPRWKLHNNMEATGADTEMSEVPQLLLSLNILATIRVAQAQHGMRHGDYKRYREYCIRRVRKLYKKLKLPQGNRNRFNRKPVELGTVKEVRHLHIPLMDAERAWSRAMEIQKSMEESGILNKRRIFMIAKFAKASKHAAHLAALCSHHCDSRTYVEAEGYAAMMKGEWKKQKEHWDGALREYKKARKLFEELSKVGEFEQQALFSQVLGELDPSIRFCKYEMDKKGSKVKVVDEDVMESLQLRLRDLAVTVKTESDPQDVATVKWCGVEYPVRNERLQIAVMETQKLEEQFQQRQELDLYDNIVASYNVLIALVKQALSAGGGANAIGVASDLEGLQTAVLGLYLQHSISRSLMQIKHQAEVFNKNLLLSLSSKRAKIRPGDLVRLHDNVIGLTGELGELGMKIGGAQGEVLMEGCGAQVAHHQAARCYYAAQSFFFLAKYEEAYALFQRCSERAQKAIGLHEELEEVDHEMIHEMESIIQKSVAFRCAAQAECSAQALGEQRKLTSQMESLSFKGEQQSKKPVEVSKYLADHLNSWESFIGSGGKGARIFRIPPALSSMPVKPIVLDTAFNHITAPDLSQRLPKQETWASMATKTFSGWTSWGTKR